MYDIYVTSNKNNIQELLSLLRKKAFQENMAHDFRRSAQLIYCPLCNDVHENNSLCQRDD